MNHACFVAGHSYQDLLHLAVHGGEFVEYEELIHLTFMGPCIINVFFQV